jgi:hypothetical protein
MMEVLKFIGDTMETHGTKLHRVDVNTVEVTFPDGTIVFLTSESAITAWQN